MADKTRASSSRPRAPRKATHARSHAKAASPKPRVKATAASKPRASRKAAKAPAPTPTPAPARRPLDIVVAMRPVRPAPAARPAQAIQPPPKAVPVRPAAAPRVPARTAARLPPSSPQSSPAPSFPRFSRMRNLLSVGILLGLVVAAVAAIPATSQGNGGTIKVHDGRGADPAQRNEPHVSGDAYVEGFNMAADRGDLLVYSWPPTGDRTLVLATNWTGDGADPAVHFLAGPFGLPCGHYRVFAYNGAGPSDPTEPQPGGAKKKTFWVDCVPPEGSPPPEMACPADLAAVANADGSVTLTWTPAPGSNGTNVYRAEDGGDFEYMDTVGPDATTWTDTTAVPSLGYEYSVTGLFGDQESRDCPVVEVTAIPELPTLAAVGLASGGGALALLLARRRRA